MSGRGLFITFEGGDGVGKSTQIDLAVSHLRKRGETVAQAREPGGTELGLELREIILHRRGYIHPRAEALLYAADRAHNIATVVRPALDRGDVVVQDRYLDSSVAYQGAGRELDADSVRGISMWAADALLPDLTLLLDLDPAIAASRVDQRAGRDRIESAGDDFRRRLRQGFLDVAAAEPKRFVVIDAAQSVKAVAREVAAAIDELLAENRTGAQHQEATRRSAPR